jgi:alpha-tubulin suppressor-like RCC1 family protein
MRAPLALVLPLVLLTTAGTCIVSPVQHSDDAGATTDARPNDAAVAVTVGADGGTATTATGASVAVPPGAVTDPTTVTISPTAPPANETGVVGTVASEAVRLGPEGATFAAAVAVTLPVDRARLPAGRTIADVRMFRAPAGTTAFEEIPSRVEGGAIVGLTTHFSDFVAAIPASGAPACSDGLKNGAETDIDCGGSCAPCADGKSCGAAPDCASHVCTGALCREGFQALALGADHTCALSTSGRVKCWGAGRAGPIERGHLGRGSSTFPDGTPGTMGANLPAIPTNGALVAEVRAGNSTTCLRFQDGTVACLGANSSGELGQGDTVPRGSSAADLGAGLARVPLGSGVSVKTLASGAGTCALTTTGAVKCWGANGSGELGLGDTNARGDEPGEMGNALPTVDLGAGRTAIALTQGAGFACAILDTNAVKCWGANDSGQLGLGDTRARGDDAGEMGDALPAIDLGTGRTARAIAAGGPSICALLDNDTLKCWGAPRGLGDTNSRGDAPGEMGDALPAIDVGEPVRGFSLGFGHVCVLLAAGRTKCFGANAAGQLGLGDTAARGNLPGEVLGLPVLDLGSGRSARTIVAGSGRNGALGPVAHTCALLNDGSAKCWGFNESLQCGYPFGPYAGTKPGGLGDALVATSVW